MGADVQMNDLTTELMELANSLELENQKLAGEVAELKLQLNDLRQLIAEQDDVIVEKDDIIVAKLNELTFVQEQLQASQALIGHLLRKEADIKAMTKSMHHLNVELKV